jgi:Bacterial Ig domain/Metallo-peptidase family M12/Secretion system C-terminal sorting domain
LINPPPSITISTIFVWNTQDTYSTTSSSTALNQFKTTRPSFNGNLAQLVTLGGKGTGGVAWVDALCNSSYAYSYANIDATYKSFPTYSWTVEVMTHEMGHNFGSPHTHSCTWTGGALDNCYTTEGGCPAGPAPINGGTVMSYCHLTSNGINLSNGFGTQPGDRIRSRITAATCLPASCSALNTPPIVSISAPANNANFLAPATFTISASASDADGSVTQVQFYNGTTLLGTDITAPYSYAWANVAVGTYSITAKATDNSGATTTSAIVSVVVAANTPPTVSISSPVNNASFTAPASITINANAADVGGSVTQVQFYNGTTLLGTDITSPYSYTWTNVVAGTYAITAKATDNSAAATISAAVSVVVNAPCVDNYEPNNALTQTKPLTIGTSLNATIGSATDNDYFQFSTTVSAPKVKITLGNLPANYNLRLYTLQGTTTNLVASVLTTGTANKILTYNTPTAAATYIVQVFGASGVFSAIQCYSVLAQTGNTNFLIQPAVGALVTGHENKDLLLNLSPNPTSDNVQLAIETTEAGNYTLSLYDIVGKILKNDIIQLEKGDNKISLDLKAVTTGMYFISLQDKTKYVTAKLVIK